jgi:gliding motility-associated-like protein
MKKHFFILFLLLQSLYSSATHIVGGQLNYEYLGHGDWYKITLTVFRDCYYGIPKYDNPASIGIFDGVTNVRIDTLNMRTADSITIPLLLTDPCLVIPPDVCVSRAVYVDSVQLPFLASGYILAYQRCCRNNTIANIVMPESTGATYSCFISAQALQLRNSSAVFKNFPTPLICNNKAINFDHSALDKDGDRLVYKLCTPFEGASSSNPIPQPPNPPPYLPVVWNSPYSLSNVMGGVPLAVNPTTGLLTGTPNTIGQFVVGVCVEEYRNNVLISTSRRDFQYNVGRCGRQYVAAFFNPDVYCDGLTVKLNNESIAATKFAWDFGITGITTDTSTLFSPTYTFPDTGCYNIRLIAQPDKPCRDSTTSRLCLRDATIYADFDLKYKSCNDTLRIEYIDKSVDTLFQVQSWRWTWTGGGFSNQQNPDIILPNAGTYTINLEVTSTNGCKKTLSKTIDVAKFSGVRDRMIKICRGDSVALNPTGNPALQYAWSPALTLDDATKANPIARPTALSTTYETTFINYSLDTCTLTQKITVETNAYPPLLDAKATRKKIFLGQDTEVFLEPILGGTTYTWLPSPTLNNITDTRQTIAPTQNTTLIAQATDAFGCRTTDTVQIEIVTPVCTGDFVFIPNAFSPNGDRENDVLYVRSQVSDDIQLSIYNRWGEKVFETNDIKTGWDGTYKDKALAPDVYGYYLRARCWNGEIYEQKGNITLLK